MPLWPLASRGTLIELPPGALEWRQGVHSLWLCGTEWGQDAAGREVSPPRTTLILPWPCNCCSVTWWVSIQCPEFVSGYRTRKGLTWWHLKPPFSPVLFYLCTSLLTSIRAPPFTECWELRWHTRKLPVPLVAHVWWLGPQIERLPFDTMGFESGSYFWRTAYVCAWNYSNRLILHLFRLMCDTYTLT